MRLIDLIVLRIIVTFNFEASAVTDLPKAMQSIYENQRRKKCPSTIEKVSKLCNQYKPTPIKNLSARSWLQPIRILLQTDRMGNPVQSLAPIMPPYPVLGRTCTNYRPISLSACVVCPCTISSVSNNCKPIAFRRLIKRCEKVASHDTTEKSCK